MSAYAGPARVTNGLVFDMDMSNTNKSWIGRPSTNTFNYDTYNYTDGNATVTRGATPPIPPPVTGYEISKIQSNNGANTQYDILYTSSVDQVNGGVYTHSAWILLTAGTYCQVGQHWNPWDPGAYQYIPLNVWTRVSYTVTNNTNNYGNIANSYGTDGTIYVTAVQYEKGSTATPFIGGAGASRSTTQAILDLTKNNTVTATSLVYNSDNTFSFDGSTSLISLPSLNLQRDFTLECWVKLTSSGTSVGFFGQGVYATGQGLHIGWFPGRGLLFGMYANDLECPSYSMTYNTWHHFVYTYNNSTYFRQTFADGVLVASGTLTQYTGSGQFNIGAIYSSALNPFVGNFGVARAYNRVLTAAEVLQNFNATRSRYGI